MAEQLTVDQAVERAMRAQDAKITTIRDLAKGRQALSDVKDEAARKLPSWRRKTRSRSAPPNAKT